MAFNMNATSALVTLETTGAQETQPTTTDFYSLMSKTSTASTYTVPAGKKFIVVSAITHRDGGTSNYGYIGIKNASSTLVGFLLKDTSSSSETSSFSGIYVLEEDWAFEYRECLITGYLVDA